MLSVCPQATVKILPISPTLMISPSSSINIPPTKKTLSISKPVITEIPPEESHLDLPFILSQLQTMQTTVFEIQRDHTEQMNLKNEEIGVYRTALSTLRALLPNR